jgi:hypothetical protein
MHDYSAGGIGGGADEEMRAQAEALGGTAPARRTANTPGAAHTAERVRQLAEMVGVGPSGSEPRGQYTSPQARGSDDNPRRQT